ncbi:MAG: TylF/MycF/NovP-related O-methyltransferase [Pirellulales bacterium]
MRSIAKDSAMWMKNRLFQSLGGGRMERFGLGLWSRLQMSALKGRKPAAVVESLREIARDQRSLCSAFEQYLIYSLARSLNKMPGVMAEIGVFRGGTARLICEAKGDRPFYLFDTFEGLPPASEVDRGIYKEHQYTCRLDNVQAYLAKYDNLKYFKGIFPQSAADTPEEKYSFVHMDVDLYEGTKACLEYFYPRMLPGGIMISHDYGLLAGVEAAFTEFFADKPEQVIDQPTTQAMVVKL